MKRNWQNCNANKRDAKSFPPTGKRSNHAFEEVQIVAGGVTFTNVLNTSGNYLTLGQLSRFVRCGCRIRMTQTSNPAGNIMAIDVSCPGPNGVPIVNCGTSLLPATASASLASPELDKSEAPAKK